MADDGGWRHHSYLHDDPPGHSGDWPTWVAPPYPPVDLGPCPICGHATERCATWQSHGETATSYACVWCRADMEVFHTGPPGHVPTPTRPWYAPPDMRWDMCADPVPDGAPRRDHASGHWGLTLCGLSAGDLVEQGPQWRPDRTDACPTCKTQATEIDGRWPADRRTDGDFLVTCPCPTCRPADIP